MTIFENSKYTKEILEFHFPRYEELPNIELYMDQVISLIENTLKVFNSSEKEKIITSSMVNNYVKQGLVSPPVKKKYTKNHIAYIIVVCVLKQILSISEICDLIKIQIDTYPIEEAYDYFAQWIEKALKIAFTDEKDKLKENDSTKYEARIVRLATKSFANKIYLQKYLAYTTSKES
ncbi:DUF1836 domain-containing protein [Anaerofustis stercorihominis]|uniref:DUF1836 domain-containing protein n=1 Tax=Anaerofustis stercorihominis TaxID=214853 RepID=A0A3E3DZD1_9FIRM|nr:DUF1836 domain-containing protein [Anaerofustis stercorihominis]RGD74650.1 DUF1836 domain-containing protein [Anaerofustis stercorihominis]